MPSRAGSPVTLLRPPAASLDIDDAAAVTGVLAGHREMFEVIVRRYNPRLYRLGIAYLRDHARTEDAMQNTYLKAFLHLRSFHGNAAFATWLTRIMINECLMLIRGAGRFTMESINDDKTRREEPFVVPPGDPFAHQEVRAALEQAVLALPRTQRAVYLLRDVQELSTAETARCLGLTATNVKVLLHRAREELKSRLLKSATGAELFAYTATHCDPLTEQVMAAVHAAERIPRGS